jgi:hypothetical protein
MAQRDRAPVLVVWCGRGDSSGFVAARVAQIGSLSFLRNFAPFAGQGRILPAPTMDSLYATKPPSFMDSVGAALTLGVNELADVLHTFFLNVVAEEDDD